jgi:hypothetical protein
VTGIALAALETVFEAYPEALLANRNFFRIVKTMALGASPTPVAVKVQGDAAGGGGFGSVALFTLFAVHRFGWYAAGQISYQSVTFRAVDFGV